MALFDKLKSKAATLADEALRQTAALSDDARKKATEMAGDVAKRSSKIMNDVTRKSAEISEEVSKKSAEVWEEAGEWTSKTWDEKVPSKEELSEWAAGAADYISSFAKDFDPAKMWDKLKECAAKAGQEIVIMVLTMYYTIKESMTNQKAK